MWCHTTRPSRISNSIIQTRVLVITKKCNNFWKTSHQTKKGKFIWNFHHRQKFHRHQLHVLSFDRILHLFPWSGIINADSELSETFRVPDPKTGQMRRLISQIPPKEEEMFRNMIRRINTIVKVSHSRFRILDDWFFKFNYYHGNLGCWGFGCAYYGWCWANLLPTGHFAHHSGNDAKI